jgi:hypothetical protein
MKTDDSTDSGKQLDKSEDQGGFSVDEYFFTKNGIDSVHEAHEVINKIAEPLREVGRVFYSNLLGSALTAMSFIVLAKRLAYGVSYQNMIGFSVWDTWREERRSS